MLKKTYAESIAYYSFVVNMISIFCLSYREETLMYSNIIFGINAIFMLVAIVLRNKTVKFNSLHLWLVCMLGWCFASTLWSINPDNVLIECWTMTQLFAYTAILYEFFRYRENAIQEMLQAYFVGGVVMAIYAVDLYSIGDITAAFFTKIRLGTEINQINVFGMTAAFTSIFGLYLFNHKGNKLYFGGGVLSLIMALTSGSAKAFGIIILGMIIIYWDKINKKRLLSLLGVCVILFGFISLLQTGYDINIIKRFSDTFNIFTGTGSANSTFTLRLYYIQLGWDAFLEHPILGYGLGNFGAILLSVMGYATYAHNNYIELLVSLGIVGCILYYSLYFDILKKLYKKGNAFFLFNILLLVLITDIASVSYATKATYVFLTLFYIAANNNRAENADGPTNLP